MTRAMDVTETTPTPESAVPARKRPGPKPGRRPGPKPKAVLASTNGHGVNGAVAPVSALAALKHELASTEAQAGRLKRALAALEG